MTEFVTSAQIDLEEEEEEEEEECADPGVTRSRKYSLKDIAEMPRAFMTYLAVAEELNNVDAHVRNHMGLDGEGTEGTYGSISFNCLLRLVWDLVVHGDVLNPLQAPSIGRRTGSGSSAVGREHAAAAGRPRVVDFGAGTGRALVLLQALNLVEWAVGFEVDETKVLKAELYMESLVAQACGRHLQLRRDVPEVVLRDLERLTDKEVAQHRPTLGYGFWAGIPPRAQAALFALFMRCASMQVLLLVGHASRSARHLRALVADWGGRGGVAAEVHRVVTDVTPLGNKGTYSAFVIRKQRAAAATGTNGHA